MIRSFADKRTVAVFRGERVPRIREDVARAAKRKLDLLHAAARVEKLKGDRSGQWSVRVNDQWRICFRWDGHEAHDVELVDYH